MNFLQKKNITYLSYIDNASILAGVSTRIGGYSTGEYSTMNLGINTQDDPLLVRKNREHFFSSIAPSFEIIHLNQTHSATVHDADTPTFQSFSDGDGLITTETGKLLCVSIADCGSVIFHDDLFTIACAIHCGWRGTKSGIIQEALRLLSQWTDLSNIHAYIGPMIRQSSYEVGQEFSSMFGSEYFSDQAGRRMFDLNALIINTLTRAGLSSISDCGYDTYQEPSLFFSHRRSPHAGRMCAFVGLKP
jgi:YfiH family protein